MKIVYRPKGRALEYSLLALNPWGKSWCSHGCRYCYTSSTFRMSRAQWEKQSFRPRKDLIKLLRQDCEDLRGTDERLLCCFAGDLYSPEAAITGISRQILETFREFEVPFQVLTKGGMRAAPDFDLYGPRDAFASTLTFAANSDSLLYEPGAALPDNRLEAIYRAKELGIQTWVSLEPVIRPDDALYWIWRLSDRSGERFQIGKLNHDPAAEARIDWRAFGIQAVTLLESLGKKYWIKADLAKYLDGVSYVNTDMRKVSR